MTKRRRKCLVPGLVIAALLIGIAIPVYKTTIRISREKTLRANLLALRDVIDQYTADKKRAPQTLQDLVDAGYFRKAADRPCHQIGFNVGTRHGDRRYFIGKD